VKVFITPSREVNYRKALEMLRKAYRVYATYLISAPLRRKEMLQSEYWRCWTERLESGIIICDWLVSIEDKHKFNDLLDEFLKALIEKNFEAIREGRVRIRVLINPFKYPRINLQICDVNGGQKTAIIGFGIESDIIEYGFVIEDQELISMLLNFFRRLWDRAITIIDRGINYKGIMEAGTYIGFSETELQQITEEIREIEIWHTIQEKLEVHIDIERSEERLLITAHITNNSIVSLTIEEIRDLIPRGYICVVRPEGYTIRDNDLVSDRSAQNRIDPHTSYCVRITVEPRYQPLAEEIEPKLILSNVRRPISLGKFRLVNEYEVL